MKVPKAFFLSLFGYILPEVFSLGIYRSIQELAILPFNTSVVSDETCKNDTDFWAASVNTFVSWVSVNCNKTDQQCNQMKSEMVASNIFAAKQLDAFGRIPSGLLEFNTKWQGSWEECMAVEAPHRSDYSAHYCWVSVAFNALTAGTNVSACATPALFMWTVCMPNSCNNQDTGKLLQSMGGPALKNTVSFCSVDCRPQKSPKWDAAFWGVTAYCLLVILIMLISTTVDYATSCDNEAFKKLRSSAGMRALFAFSVYTNGSEILSVEKRPGQIECLHCLRAITMMWIMAGHVLATYTNVDNLMALLNATNQAINDVFFNPFLAVDTFLFIGGLLLSYLFYKEMDKNPKKMKNPVYWILFYVHRILRVSPAYYFFIGFNTVIYYYLTNGPTQITPTDIEIEACKKYWWRNILYINNFFSSAEMCMGHSWYLAIDMQIHIFSPLLLVPLFYSRIAGAISAALFLILSVASCYAMHFKYDFPATLLQFFRDSGGPIVHIDDYMLLVYTAPWIRSAPYVIGVLTGYFLHKTKNKKLSIHPFIAIVLWCMSLAIGLACVFGLYNNIKGIPISIAAAASYDNFSRLGWAIALAWVIIACQNNLAGPIKNFLELGMWAPLSRLTYCCYLAHFLVIIIFTAQVRQPFHYVNMITMFLHDAIPVFVITFFFSFFWSCGFEVSFGKLEKMGITALVGGERRKPREENDKPVTESEHL